MNELPQLPIAYEMDALPTLAEVEAATAGMKNGKAAGPDGIPPEVFKYGGGDLNELLLCYFVECWCGASTHVIFRLLFRRGIFKLQRTLNTLILSTLFTPHNIQITIFALRTFAVY